MMLLMLLSVLLWSLSENHCQRLIPYLHFNGQNLTNHSYVDLNEVGHTGNKGLQCHTDLRNCCSIAEGSFRGDWYFPNGTMLLYPKEHGFYEGRGAKIVNLYRNTQATSPTGIFTAKFHTTITTPRMRLSMLDCMIIAAGMFSIAT